MADAQGIRKSLSVILNDDIYRRGFASSRDKWLDVDDDEAIEWLIRFFGE
jgi:hypothetical protein